MKTATKKSMARKKQGQDGSQPAAPQEEARQGPQEQPQKAHSTPSAVREQGQPETSQEAAQGRRRKGRGFTAVKSARLKARAEEYLKELRRDWHDYKHLGTACVQRKVAIGRRLNKAEKEFGKDYKRLIVKKLPFSGSWASQAQAVARYWPRIEKAKEYLDHPGVETARRLAVQYKREAGESDGRVRSGRRPKQQQQRPPLPGDVEAPKPDPTGTDWLEAGGGLISYLDTTAARTPEYLNSDKDWPPQSDPFKMSAVLEGARRCAGLFDNLAARANSSLHGGEAGQEVPTLRVRLTLHGVLNGFPPGAGPEEVLEALKAGMAHVHGTVERRSGADWCNLTDCEVEAAEEVIA
jgi:hypothetical protein